MKIISASRRTDIPAYHTDWFLQRISEGFVRWRSPFGGRELEISLAPTDVSAIVFWSKDYRPLLPHLPALHRCGYRFLFHFTITGLPNIFEPNVPSADEMVSTAQELARRFGPETVLWRYDPILISTITPPAYHRERFADLASRLAGCTYRCYFSFPTFYGKVIRSVTQLERETGVACIDPPVQEKIALAADLADTAGSLGIQMLTCCGDYLTSDRIAKAHCIDAELLSHLYPDREFTRTIKGTREQCGCFESTDIGTYDTCGHNCVYCYANRPRMWGRTRASDG